MREFKDQQGSTWVASVSGQDGGDYKGRYHFVVRPADAVGGEGEEIALQEIRWNSQLTAERTLATMSEVELRRRLRSALGRSPTYSNGS
ncbi:MAG: hypothetical protein WEA09_07900 [Gemmatimonadota bacterium]